MWSIERRSEDLDGDGAPEDVELFSDGRLVLAGETYSFVLHHPMTRDQPEWRTAGIDIVDVRRGDGRRELLFWQHGPDDEDPPREHVFFSRVDGGTFVSDTVTAPVAPTIRGNGTIRFRFERCVRDGRSARSDIQLAMSRAGVIERVSESTRHVDSACVFAACPTVIVGGRRLGNILRHRRDASMEGEESLALPVDAVEAGTVTVTLRELEPETTHLDAIHLVVDGHVVQTRSCGGAPWCASDGQHLTLRRGQEQVFVFELPCVHDAAACSRAPRELRLVARGYYEPYVTAALH